MKNKELTQKDCLERAKEAVKEVYCDLMTHPSEAGPKGAALLDEYLTKLESRIEAELGETKE